LTEAFSLWIQMISCLLWNWRTEATH